MLLRRFRHLFLLLLTVALMLPVLALLGAWLPGGAGEGQALQILAEMARTVLPDYVLTSLLLCGLVAAGVIVIGLSSAATVTLFDFPGRRFFEWALLLPLAMPAYVVAYAYTDFLQFSGPLQTWLRAATGGQGRMFPEIRNTAGAAWVLTFALYPYVYLLARTALAERATHLMEAARLMGAPLSRRIREVALPLARPAVAAGVALALMETLADFGVASYFGIQTFTAGIYKAWLAMDNRLAAAQLATLLLALVALLLWLEHRSQQRMRFVGSRLGRAAGSEARPIALQGPRRWAAWGVCSLPLLMGFVAPVLFMFRPLLADWSELPWDRFVVWAGNSVRLGALSAVLAVGLALLLAYSLRRAMRCPAPWWWSGCCCPWAGCRRPGHRAARLTGSRPRRWAWSGPTWCALWPWPCSRCKVVMRAYRPIWTTAPACWAAAAGACCAGCTGPCCGARLWPPCCWCSWM